ncbi:MAG: carbon-nitrogen hydrolase family protein [Armatimonadota bacterium]
MRRILLITAACTILSAATITLQASQGRSVARFQAFPAAENRMPEGWSTWTPREEISPRFTVSRSGDGSLEIECSHPAEVGAWRREVVGIRAGEPYAFSARYRVEKVAHPQQQVYARLEWLDDAGRSLRAPDYVLEAGNGRGWTEVRHRAAAPEKAAAVRIELGLRWAPGGRVWWDDVRLDAEAASPRRKVRVGTVYLRPHGTGSAAGSVEAFCRTVEAGAEEKPDIVCLPEGVSVVGTGKSYAEVAEPVPGPTTQRLAALAKRLGSYVVGGLYEREGPVIYNTAVLIGRGGELVGKYRKTHLPREEVDAGLTPGNDYPVFDTDFGRVGLIICWDVQFPEPSRAMAAKGAELLLLPIWGGSEIVTRARAIENHAYLVSSSYDMKSFVVAPDGEVLTEATKQRPFAVTEIDLDRKILQPWLGDMKPRTWRERRADLPVPTPEVRLP